MGESAKALLGGLIFLSAIAELCLWITKGIPSTPVVWSFRLGLPVLIISAVATLVWASRRKDVAPDFLRMFLGTPFERDGVCFTVIPAVRNGVAYINIVYQNQYASSCSFRVVVVPSDKSFFGKHIYPGVALDIECEGGVLGVARTPIGVPAKYHGVKSSFDVAAATRYANGNGELLRFRNGLRAGKADASGLGSAALTAGLLLLGQIHFSRPASVKLIFPTGVAEKAPSSEQPSIKALWRPGDVDDDVAEKLRGALTFT